MQTKRRIQVKLCVVRVALAVFVMSLLGPGCKLEVDKVRSELVVGSGGGGKDLFSLEVIPKVLVMAPDSSRALTVVGASMTDVYARLEGLSITGAGEPRDDVGLSLVSVEYDPNEFVPKSFQARYLVQAPATAGIYRITFKQEIVKLAVEVTVVVVPVAFEGLPGAIQIAAGEFHSLAVLADGSVVSWGLNDRGQLGDGTTVSKPAPVRVQGLPGPAVAVAAGGHHSMALLADGTVWCWGDNTKDQLLIQIKRGPYVKLSLSPIQAMYDSHVSFSDCDKEEGIEWFPLVDVVAISAGRYHSMALTADGRVRTSTGEGCGGGFEDDRAGFYVRMTAIAAGSEFSLMLDGHGQVWGRGANKAGQLNVAPNSNDVTGSVEAPVAMPSFSDVRAIAAGGSHTLALRNDGTILAVGDNTYGQLGVEGSGGYTAVTVPGLSGIVAIDAGISYSLALGADGTLYTWGNGDPVPVPKESVYWIRAIAAGGEHALALPLACPSVLSWGNNDEGQLGDGTGQSNNDFVQVDGIGEEGEPGPCEIPLSVLAQGKGRVWSNLRGVAWGGIDCGADCSQSFTRATEISLTATPDEGWVFDHWAGDAQGPERTVDLRMDATRNCIAYFAPGVDPPTARFTFTPQYPLTTDKVVFDASGSTDNSRIVLYQWDFDNDGDIDGAMRNTALDGSFTAAFVRKFWKAGTYTVRLRVTDDDGLTNETTGQVRVSQPEQPEYDLGDAPDSSNSAERPMLAYPDQGVEAHYPTAYHAGSPPYGPRHYKSQNGVHLGRTVTLENEADVGVDEDPNNNLDWRSGLPDQDGGDDGVQLPLVLPYAEEATLDYTLTITNPPWRYLYVNVWFDWNRDGDWDDTLTGPDGVPVPEWAVRDEGLSMFLPAGLHTMTTGPFVCWHPSKANASDPLWMRITVAEQPWWSIADPNVAGSGGAGPAEGYRYGETEDYLVIPSP